jgi:predicted kinase
MIIQFKQFLLEGKMVNFINSSGNFVVLMGGPGAGKSTAIDNINLDNYKIFNVDYERERSAEHLGLDLNIPEDNDVVLKHTFGTTDKRNRTINLLKSTLKHTNTNTNIIFDTTGTHIDFMKDIINLAKKRFTTTLILVDVDVDKAIDRNLNRKRKLKTDLVRSYHNKIPTAFSILSNMVDYVWTIDSNINITKRSSDITKKIK